jgi:hypothetical protein
MSTVVAPPATASNAVSSKPEPAGLSVSLQDDDQQPAEKIEAVEARLVRLRVPYSTLNPHRVARVEPPHVPRRSSQSASCAQAA